MSTSDDVKAAADAVALAKAAESAAALVVDTKQAEALALITSDVAAFDAAQQAYFAALDAAQNTVGYPAAIADLGSAMATRESAVAVLTDVAANYNGA